MSVELSLLTFTAAAALLTITPGLDTALVLRTTAVEGAAQARRTGLGIAAGCLSWGLLVAFGLGALIAVSELAYNAVKIAGAVYLVWLGVTLLLSRKHAATEAPAGGAGAGHFRRGFLTNILNPKVGIFYVSFLPQFIPPEAHVPTMTLVMTAIHVCLGLAWFALLVAATRPLARAFRNHIFVAWLDRLTGGLFVALGVRLAFEQRP